MAAVLSALPSSTALAATGINKQISFQGKVVNSNGTNVTNGTYSFVFSIYTVSSAGSNIWTETKSLIVTDGVFQTNLGSTTSLPGSVDFNTDNIYLGINFNSDGEMTPRIQFTAAAYAFNADNANKLGGIVATSYAQLSPGSAQSGNLSVTGTVNGATLSGGTLSGSTLSGSSLTFSAASGAGIQAAANQNLTLSTVTSGTLALASAGAVNITGAANSTFDVGSGNTLSLQTTNNGPITTGSGLLTDGGNFTFSGTTARTITGPSTGGLTITDASGNLTLSTTTSGNIAATSAGTIALSGTNFGLTTAGVITLAGNQTADITTTASGTANPITIQPGSSSTNSATGAALTIKGGNESGTTSTGGSITIDAGTGTTNGNVSIGTGNAATTAVGRSGAALTVTGNGATAATTVIDLRVAADANARFTVGADGKLSFGAGTAATDSTISRTGAKTLTVAANIVVTGGNASTTVLKSNINTANQIGFVVQGASAQTGDLVELQDNSGNVNAAFNAAGNQLTLGNNTASGTTQGKLLFTDGTSDGFTSTLQAAPISGSSKTVTLPNETGTVCTTASGGVCSALGFYIQNQNAGTQASSNFIISGSGTAVTSFLTPLLDTPSGTTILAVGTTNATAGINLNQNTSVTGTKTFNVAGGNATFGANVGINNASAPNKLSVGTLGTADSLFQATISTGANGNKGLLIQGVSGEAQSDRAIDVQLSTGTSEFSVDLFGNVRGASSFGIASNSVTDGKFTKQMTAGTGGVSINDVVILANDSGNARVIDTTTVRDTRVYGIATATTTVGNGLSVVIAGNYQVTATTAAVAIGDQLVTSATSGQVQTDNNATTGIVGVASTAKAGGSSGLVGVTVGAVRGQTNPDFGAGNLTTTGTLSSGLINGQTITSAANFTGTVTTATSFTAPALTSTGTLAISSAVASNLTVTAGTTGTVTIDSGAAGTANLGTGNATTVSVGRAGSTTTIAGNSSSTISATNGGNTTTLSFTPATAPRAIVLPDAGGTVCLQSSASCGFATGTSASYIQNQNAGTQASSNFIISGSGTAVTSFLTPLLDSPAGTTTLAIGTTNATSGINLNQNTSITGTKTLAVGGTTTLTGTLTVNNTTYVNTNSTTALNIEQNGVHNNVLTVDTTNGRVGIDQAPAAGQAFSVTGSSLFTGNVQASSFIAASSSTANNFSKNYLVGTGGVTANDVVVLVNDGGASAVTRTTTARDIRVMGVALVSGVATANVAIGILGNYQVTADTGAVAIGDQLITSTTSGQVTVDNSATTGILGYATSAKGAGASGLVGVYIYPTNGVVNPNLQAGNITTTGTISSGLINGQTISAAANFTGTITAVSTIQGTSIDGTTGINTGAAGGTQRIDNTGNLVNIGNITTTGASTLSTGANTLTVTSSDFNVTSAGAVTAISTIQGTSVDGTTGLNTGAAGGTQRIDNTGNLVNIGNITTTGASTITTGANTLTLTSSNFNVTSAGAVTAASTIQGTSVDGTTGINTGATGGTQRIDNTGNLVNIGNITTLAASTISTGANTLTVTSSNVNITSGGSLTLGASVGTGALVNNGSTVNTVYNMANLATGGWDAGGAGTTVDKYTYITAPQTTSLQTLTPPTPTSNLVYGRIVYLTNTGTTSFTLLGTSLGAGSTATLVWALVNGVAQWTLAGADSSGILNQNTAAQTANFYISGTGRATTFYGNLDTVAAGTLLVGNSNATSITVGGTTTTGTIQVGNSAASTINIGTGAFAHTIGIGTDSSTAQGVTIGSTNAGSTTSIQAPTVTIGAAGASILKNNGATFNNPCAYTGQTGAVTLNTAGKTPDVCTVINITDIAATTITVPAPAAGAGSLVFITNNANSTNPITVLGTNISVGSTATLVYSAGTVFGWTFAGSDASGLQTAYNNSATTDPQIQLSNTNGGIKIRDASGSTIGNLIQVTDSAGTTVYLSVTSAATNLTGNLTFTKEAPRTIQVTDSTTAAAAGGNLTVKAAAGNTSGVGGNLVLVAGAGGNTAVGGNASLTGGAGGGGNTAGGTAIVQGGASAGTASGGTASLLGGLASATAGSGGGAIAVTGANGAAGLNAVGGGTAGAVTVNSGTGGAGTGTNSPGGAGANIGITAGNGGASTGTAAGANGGSITLQAGTAGSVGTGTAGTAGSISLLAGTVNVGTAGASILKNNGATFNNPCAYTGVTGAVTLNTAGKTPDVCTVINITDIAATTVTVPVPAAGAGSVVYITNNANSTTPISLLSTSVSVGSTATLVYSAGTVFGWTFAGSDASGLQTAYNNSAATDPQIQLSNTNGGLKIRDAASSTIGNLLQVTDSTGATVYLSVTSAASNLTGNLTFTKEAPRTIQVTDSTTAAAAGGNITVKAAAGNTSGTGGNLILVAGAGGAAGIGGIASLTGGAAGGGNTAGGGATVQGGAAAGTGAGGTVTITGGLAASTAGSLGGVVNINGGAGTGTTTGAAGSAVSINGGNAGGTGANNGGAIGLQGGTATSTGTGGAVTITGGTGSTTAASAGGTVILQGGASGAVAGGVTGGVSILGGVASTTGAGGAGGSITITASAGGTGNNNGGNITLTPGANTGTGIPGVVSIDTPVFTAYTNTTCASSCSLTTGTAGIDGYSTALVSVSTTGQVVTLPDPANTAAGRIVYITAMPTSNDFTLQANSGALSISMRADSTATMVWTGGAGGDWTAAGADSSTSLQQTYNNTSTSPASIITTSTAKNILFQAGSGSDVNDIFQVANSVGATLLAVDSTNTATGAQLAQNGGGEVGGTPPTGWSAYVGTATPVITQTTTAGEFTSGIGGVKVTIGSAGTGGVNNALNATALSTTATTYVVSFSIKAQTSAPTNANIIVEYYRNSTPTLDATCSAFTATTNPVITTTGFIKYTCSFTSTGNAKATTNFIRIRQADSVIRNLLIDNFSLIAQSTTGAQVFSDIKVGGSSSQGLTLLTVDSFSGAPAATGSTINPDFLGSLYYDTTIGKLQCYEAKGWGSCGNSPNNSAFLIPEYPNAVLGAQSAYPGTALVAGVGTMTAGLCSGSGRLGLDTTLCATTTDDYNYYKWTSPQATSQTYSIYVRYQLPATYNGFLSSSTVKLYGRTTSTTDGSVVYSLWSATGSKPCGDSATLGTTTVTTANNTWQQVALAADETSGAVDCVFAANDIVTFRIDMTAKNNASVYASNLTFTTKGL